jgi:conjugative transposon TraM protein
MKETRTDDPEMKQLDSLLEKILDVQHPARVKERLDEESKQQSGAFFTVRQAVGTVPVSVMSAEQDTVSAIPGTATSSIAAEVQETSTMVNGSVIKLRLLDDIRVGTSVIPKDHFVFGTARLDGERLKVTISSILFKNVLFPVNMYVFDLDGIEGIYIPGSVNRDVTKQSADNSLQLMDGASFNPTFKAQIAAAGIGAAKGLLSKKIKLVRCTVKAGYRVLLCPGRN